MTINSREVSTKIKDEIRPLLEGESFTKFTSRKAWRFFPNVVHEIDIRSLGSYNAKRLNTTSFSFSVYIGIAYLAASKYPWFEWLQSEDSPQHAYLSRKTLRKWLIQPELPRPDVWYVDQMGTNLVDVIGDASKAIINQALPWLDKYSSMKLALRSFESKSDTSYKPGIMDEHFGGKVGSLFRARIASVLALEMGKKRKAIQIWTKLLKNPRYR